MISKRPLLVFACVSSAAVALGAVVCAMSGVAPGLWARNLAAWVVGGLLAVALARWAGPRAIAAAALLGPAGLAATLFNPGLEGVHRWIPVGPVTVNAALLLLPALVVATAVLSARAWWGWLPAILALPVLALQPDASQATSFAMAVCVLAAARPSDPPRVGGAVRGLVAAAAVMVAAWTWTRPDPLRPVPEVEEIILLAASHSPYLAAVGLLLLAAVAATPVLATRGRGLATAPGAGLAVSALFAGWVIAPFLGAFPTPLIGVGLSPILGAWIGLGLLASRQR